MKKFLHTICLISLCTLSFICRAHNHIQVGFCKQYTSGNLDTTFSREVTVFDTTGNILYFEDDLSNNPNDTNWTYKNCNINTYDSIDRITSKTLNSYFNGSWNQPNRTLYLYGPNQLLSEELKQHYILGIWENDQDWLYNYNANNDIISKEERDWNGTSWDNVKKTTYSFDANNNVTQHHELTWNAGVYDTTYFEFYQYQYIGSQISVALRIYGTPTITDTLRFTHYYDSTGRDSVIYQFQCFTPACTDSLGKTIYNYSLPYDSSITDYSWTGGTWPYSSGETINYNSFGSLTYYSYYDGYEHEARTLTYNTNNYILSSFRAYGVSMHPENKSDCEYNHIWNDSLNAVAFFNDTICPGDSAYIVLSITGGLEPYTVNWTDPGIHHGPIRRVYPNGTSIYHYTVLDFSGSSYTDSVVIHSVQLASDTVMMGGVTELCPPDSLTLFAIFPDSAVSFIWSDGGSGVLGNQFTTHDTGFVVLTMLKFIPGCGNVTLHTRAEIKLQQPHPDLGVDTILCFNQNLLLDPGQFVSYLWQDGSTSPTFLVTDSAGLPGTQLYSVTVEDTNGCMSNTDSIEVTFDLCSGINGPDDFRYSIYPNPFDDFIFLSLPTTAAFELSLFDLRGSCVLEKLIRGSQQIDLSDLKSGIYLYSLKSSEIVVHGKITKQ